MFKKLRFLPIFMVLTAMIFIAASPAEKTKAADDTLADGIHLGTTDLSGMTLDEAADAMEEYYDLVAESDLTINVRNIPADVLEKMESGEEVDPEKYEVLYSIKVPVSTFDFDYDIEDALRVASTLGQKGRLVQRYKTLMDMKYGSAQLPLSYSIDDKKVKAYIEDTFVPENTQEAVDAEFSYSISGFHVTRKSQPGIRVSADLTADSILQAFENDISSKMVCNAMVGTVEPKVKDDDLKDVNFSLVATYTTKFWTYDNESNLNRSHNIMMAAKYVNGTMVQPGQRLSLNQTIGQRTEARGFKVGHAYLNGKVIDEVGGGICQFATTLYQCLLQTELEVNARKNHSMRVDYVDYSQDATLDWPSVDLVFTNTWKYPIYITCSTNFGYPSTVTVNFYSYDERPKNRTVEYKTVVDATEKTLYPQIVTDSSKAPGTPTSSGVVLDAVSSHIEKIVRVNGVEQSRTRMNNDFYRALRRIVTVGSKGLGIYVSRENGIDQVKDGSGNYLLLNSKYEPIANGRGGYLLAKDYKHDANNVAVYSGGSLVPIGGGSTPTPHSHSYTSWKSNGDGTHTGTCSCGDKKTENCSFDSKGKCTVCGYTKPTEPSVPPTTEDPKPTEPTKPAACSHKWDGGKVTKEATCTKEGVKTYTCTKCGETKTEKIAALGHSWDGGKVTKEPTCSSSGVKTYTCTRCGETRTEDVPATGQHSYGSWGAWTSNNNGTHSHSHSCSGCGDTQTETQNCTYTDVVTPPTTTSQGYTTHTCTVCGYSYVDSYTDPLPTDPEPTPEQPTDPAWIPVRKLAFFLPDLNS